MQNTAFSVWQDISGSGMLIALYICALVFLFFQEKTKYIRVLLVYLSIIWLGILFLPITYRVIATIIDEELYYRFFWMLPMTLVIAYALVQAYQLYRGVWKKAAAVGAAVLLMLCGDFVYNNWRYSAAENIYHVPQSVVDICDTIHAEGREVMALFPIELMQYVKQYDSTIWMPYGRDTLVSNWSIDSELYEIMEKEVVEEVLLAEKSVEYGCAYIVIKEDRKTEGDLTKALEDKGYVLKDTLHGYSVYYNHEIFWSIYN